VIYINKGGIWLMALVVIEGLDGAGSSTQVDLLIKYLQAIGKKVDVSFSKL